MSESMGMSIEQLDDLCANWPGATRAIKWDVDLVWSVSGKMFVILCTIGPERGRLSFKVGPERFLELTDQPGISSAPYMARAYWVSINETQHFSEAELANHVRQSYELVRAGLPKKTQRILGVTLP
ncbi:MmcQ/YjbR family DNA-binding protein [Dokdonella immobilis]|uniref:Predicted DNA-binding protein, MmcQ/YjbR family n=1 Tax=Dokdonella immobilis TaxID=578942 RepID=A0A1I4V8W2_9GAMM|nr:MmcQ/YjbR family DNA-binding protein [Dokdonella immobilis]SFM97598.1 Predicted DNA-binding protein, MmcQ/YjbR family [Dokdonella immobilis]